MSQTVDDHRGVWTVRRAFRSRNSSSENSFNFRSNLSSGACHCSGRPCSFPSLLHPRATRAILARSTLIRAESSAKGEGFNEVITAPLSRTCPPCLPHSLCRQINTGKLKSRAECFINTFQTWHFREHKSGSSHRSRSFRLGRRPSFANHRRHQRHLPSCSVPFG